MNKAIEKKNKKSLARDDRGLSTVEYIIILVLIAAAAVSLWSEFGGMIQGKLSDSSAAIDEELVISGD